MGVGLIGALDTKGAEGWNLSWAYKTEQDVVNRR